MRPCPDPPGDIPRQVSAGPAPAVSLDAGGAGRQMTIRPAALALKSSGACCRALERCCMNTSC